MGTGVMENRKARVQDDAEFLLERGLFPHRPTLENRVAYQWERDGDVVGFWNNTKKNFLTLQYLANAAGGPDGTKPSAVLDVGCAYGNMLLMLNAKLGKRQDVRLVGVDLHGDAIRYAQAFARQVPGYENCEYHVADLAAGLPFEDKSFDAVNLGDVLEHMEQPAKVVQELMRISKPGGLILISTPLKTGVFKTLARAANWLTGGKVYQSYYAGKDTPLDTEGQPVMVTAAGHDHISEMTYKDLIGLLRSQGLKIEKCHMMPVMSGSRSFDRHPFILSWLMFIEALHGIFQFRSWAHSVVIAARMPS